MPPCPFHALADAFAGGRPETTSTVAGPGELAFLDEAHQAPQAAARRAEIGHALAAGRPARDLQFADFFNRGDLLEKGHQIRVVVHQGPVVAAR